MIGLSVVNKTTYIEYQIINETGILAAHSLDCLGVRVLLWQQCHQSPRGYHHDFLFLRMFSMQH